MVLFGNTKKYPYVYTTKRNTMTKSNSFKQFAANVAKVYQNQPSEVDGYLKAHNVCFKACASAQFYNDLQLCINAGRADLVEYIVGRDMHTAFALWAFNRRPSDIITEFFNKQSTQAAVSLMALNSMK